MKTTYAEKIFFFTFPYNAGEKYYKNREFSGSSLTSGSIRVTVTLTVSFLLRRLECNLVIPHLVKFV